MTIKEKVTEVINDYVNLNGIASKMTPDQLYSLVTATYPMNRNSFLPADYCYNRTNEGIDFEKHVHLFARTDEGNYLILGENYPYSGPVYYRKRGETKDSICGVWTNGLYEAGVMVAEAIKPRFYDLLESVENVLKTMPVTVVPDKNSVLVQYQESIVCVISVKYEVYKIHEVTSDWKEKTSYYCELADNKTWYYFLETIDECVGEAQRIVLFEMNNQSKNRLNQ